MFKVIITVVLMILSLIVTLTVSFQGKGSSRYQIQYKPLDIRMDDEVARVGIKTELTTKEEYLDLKFVKLSPSGHDVTRFDDGDRKEWIEDYKDIYDSYNIKDSDAFLGSNRKGLYVSCIGGLPLFSSGYRVENECNRSVLTFDAPCDDDHIVNNNNKIYCIRSGLHIGMFEKEKYVVQAATLRFLDINQRLPVSSQPENFWGTEGQFCAWNSNEMLNKPLSY